MPRFDIPYPGNMLMSPTNCWSIRVFTVFSAMPSRGPTAVRRWIQSRLPRTTSLVAATNVSRTIWRMPTDWFGSRPRPGITWLTMK